MTFLRRQAQTGEASRCPVQFAEKMPRCTCNILSKLKEKVKSVPFRKSLIGHSRPHSLLALLAGKALHKGYMGLRHMT